MKNKRWVRMLSDKLFSITKFGALARTLFLLQLAFIKDPAKRKVALCTRRAGKSHAAAIYLLIEAARISNCDVLYLGLTRTSCKNIMWPKFAELNAKHDLKLDMVESSLLIKLPNGSRIHLFGADLENLADRLRGAAYALVIIDEAQSFGMHLIYLLHDVLEPATMDFQAAIALIGTPGNISAGCFFEACNSARWSQHHWSVLDNSFVPHAANWLSALKEERGWDDNHPTWRREYLAEWCHDPDSLVYRVNNATYELLPEIIFDFIIGLDYGYNDQTAFSVVAYSPKWPIGYGVECYGKDKMIPSKIADELRMLMHKYKPERIVADTGGLGKSITEEMRIRYELPIYPADKTEKNTFIEMMNGDFVNKKFLINKIICETLLCQMHQLTWDDKHKENQSLKNDLCDATLYAYRFSRHYWGKEEIKLSAPDRMELELLEHAQNRNANSWVDEL